MGHHEWNRQTMLSLWRAQASDRTEQTKIVRLRSLARHGLRQLGGWYAAIAEHRRDYNELRRSSEQLRELSARLQSAREAERARIAAAIHDEIGQILTGLRMDVAWLQKHMDMDAQPPLLDKTRAMCDLIDDAIVWVRQISSDLRPVVLDNLGLVAAIEWQLDECAQRTGMQTSLICAINETALESDSATALFRIFQEALTNIVRHANASQIEAQLEERAGQIRLQLHDNGRGITERELHSPRSIGLLGMRERARQYAGTLELYGSPAQGTTVVVIMPLQPEKGSDSVARTGSSASSFAL